MSSLRVCVVADVRMHAEGVARLLEPVAGVVVVGTAGIDEAAQKVRESRPDAVVFDVVNADVTAAVRAVRAAASDAAVVVVAPDDLDRVIGPLAEAGVSNVVTPDDSADDVVAAMLSAQRGDARLPPSASGSLLRHVRKTAESGREQEDLRLSPREWEIAELLRQRLSNVAIAERLHVSISTVKNHLHNMYGKVGVTNREELRDKLARLRR